MQKFAALDDRVSDRVEDLYGESIRIEPRTDGELMKGGPDESRPPVTLTAIVDFQPAVLKSKYDGRFDAKAPDLSGEKLHVSIRRSVLSYDLKQGDRIVMLDRSGETVTIGAAPEYDGIGRVLCRCKPAKASSPP